MKKVHNGKYEYKGFEVINRGYYSSDKRIWWEAVNIETGCADYHAHTKRGIKRLIEIHGNSGTHFKKGELK